MPRDYTRKTFLYSETNSVSARMVFKKIPSILYCEKNYTIVFLLPLDEYSIQLGDMVALLFERREGYPYQKLVSRTIFSYTKVFCRIVNVFLWLEGGPGASRRTVGGAYSNQ